jgi:hypothetical protein
MNNKRKMKKKKDWNERTYDCQWPGYQVKSVVVGKLKPMKLM